MRRCNRCGETKPEADFYPVAKGRPALLARCKPCEVARNANRRRDLSPPLSSGRRCPVEAVRNPDGSIDLVKRGAA